MLSFSKQLANENCNDYSCANATVNEHNNSFHERIKIINNNFSLGQNNKNNEFKNVIINGESMLNNINSRGLSKLNKVFVSKYPGATSENILSAVEET